jgi:hypothetical protein
MIERSGVLSWHRGTSPNRDIPKVAWVAVLAAVAVAEEKDLRCNAAPWHLPDADLRFLFDGMDLLGIRN